MPTVGIEEIAFRYLYPSRRAKLIAWLATNYL